MEVNVYFSDFMTTIDMSPMEFSVIPARGAAGADGAPGQNGRDGTIENLNVTATTLSAGSSATATYANNLLTLGIPRGNTGSKGNTGNTGPTGNGIASIEKTGTEDRVDTYTITMTNGTTSTFTVTNGMDVVGGITNTASGDVATFADGGDDLPVDNLTVGIEYAQDLHGYDSPWPAGGGKNKLPITISTGTTSGVTFTVNADGTISLSGTATAAINKVINDTTKLVSGTSYKIAGCPTGSNGTNYFLRSSRGIVTGTSGPDFGASATATDEALYLYIHIDNGVNTNGLVFKPMVCLATETDPAFAPYSNICPITGWTGANIYREDEYDSGATASYTVSWQSTAGTVYSGTLDVTNGKLTVDRANIASYAGETLPGAWISSMDAYAPGATPTTGAQVVYELDTPVIYDLTPTEVKTLSGDNAIWADTGSTTVRYYTDTYVDVLNNVLAMIPMDTALSTTSENAVQNKVIAAAVNAKADSADVYTKTEADNLLSAKAAAADVYTKTETNGLLANKLTTADLLDLVYPVGSIYMSVSDVSPATIIGGTWVSFAAGRVLVGIDPEDEDFDDSQNTGGEKTVTLTVEEMPSHKHYLNIHSSGSGGGAAGVVTWSNNTLTNAYEANSVGGDQPHNNMPPYITCYMWRRTT